MSYKILANRRTGDIFTVEVVARHPALESVNSPCTEVLDGVRRTKMIPDDSKILKLFDDKAEALKWAGQPE